MRIWKWELDVTDHQTIMLPKGAKILDVQTQGGVCCLWALCDQRADPSPRHIAIYGTGNPIPDDAGDYISTFQMHSGSLVFHVFEIGA